MSNLIDDLFSGIVSRRNFIELAAKAGLAPGVDENVAITVEFLDRVISYWSLVLVGIVFYFVTRKR